MPGNSECLFCQIASKEQDAEIVGESENTISFLDVNPSSPGHTMVVPKSHKPTILDLDKNELTELFEQVKKMVSKINRALGPGGFTIGVNQDEAAGQHLPHFHVHIIPRFEGDKGGPVQAVVKNPPEKDIRTIGGIIRGEEEDFDIRVPETEEETEEKPKGSLEEEILELEEEELEDLKKIMKKLKIPD